MGYAILRIAKRKSAGSVSAMVGHALRSRAVANAIADAPPPTPLIGAQTVAEAMSTLRDTIAEARSLGGRQGYTKASTPALDILVTSSHESMQAMSKAQQDSFFSDALEFIGTRFGGMQNILTAVIHRDETTPHMQVLVMPYDHTTNHFCASRMIGGPVGLSQLQDAYWEAVGQPRGLERGERGSRAEHVPVRRLYAAMNAGLPVPEMRPVPPAPGLLDRLRPGYESKKKARADALAYNGGVKKRVLEQAAVAGRMHPTLIERQSERYREHVRQAQTLAAAKAAGAADLATVTTRLQAAERAERETRLLAQSADTIWTKSGAQMIDRMSAHLDPSDVHRVAARLKIQLVPGKKILDQMRRQGIGGTLIGCARILDDILDQSMSTKIRHTEQHRQTE